MQTQICDVAALRADAVDFRTVEKDKEKEKEKGFCGERMGFGPRFWKRGYLRESLIEG